MYRVPWVKRASVPDSGNSLCQGPVTERVGNFKSPIGAKGAGTQESGGEGPPGLSKELDLHSRSPGELWKGAELVNGGA